MGTASTEGDEARGAGAVPSSGTSGATAVEGPGSERVREGVGEREKSADGSTGKDDARGDTRGDKRGDGEREPSTGILTGGGCAGSGGGEGSCGNWGV